MDQRIERNERKRQVLSPRFVREMLAGHSALGLAFAALIYIVCLTGTLAVFAYELKRWEQPDGPRIDVPVSPDAVAAAVNAGYLQAREDKADHDVFVMGPGGLTPRLLVNYHDHETGAEGNWLADPQGKLVSRARSPFTDFVLGLHIHLHLPRTIGMLLVGLTGVALLSSLISGVLAHPRIFKDAFFLRRGGSPRLQEADLHNRLGVWGLPFHVAVSLTGALLGLSTLIIGVLALAAYDGDSGKAFETLLGPRASADETPAPVPDVAAMIRHIQKLKPDAAFATVHIQHIGKAGQMVHLAMRTPGHLSLANAYYFKGDGTLLGDGGLETGSVGQQILGAIPALHFGWFGGMPVKIAYGLLGLALSVITYSGVLIWLARRRDKGRPAPGWERAWVCVGWGQPLAMAATAAAAFWLEKDALVASYLIVAMMTALLAVSITSPGQLARTLRVLIAMALVAAVVAHYLSHSHTGSDPMAWMTSASLLIGAVAIAAPAVVASSRKA